MTLHIIDISIIVIYLVAVVLMGLWLRSRAGKGMDAYFLGGRSIPWYVLGGLHALCLWTKGNLATLVMAHLQSNLFNDLPGRLDSA